MSDPQTEDEMFEGQTRKFESDEADAATGELDLEALTSELETRKVSEEELAELTAIPTDSAESRGAGAAAPPTEKAKRKLALEKAQALVGKVISERYEVEEVLAAGGMGCVYRGRHMHMHKRVAIKVLLPDTEGLPDLVLRFKREAVAGAHIDHPNVAAATDFGKLDDGSFFLVQQYVRGVMLHDIIRRGPLAPERAARIARQVALALDACHTIGVVHRDLKPRNIMVEEDREDAVTLIDFGLAKVPMDRISTIDVGEAKKNFKVTRMGTIFGTVGYMAPEAADGMDAVDERSDLYALGIILYEMLAGTHPFEAGKAADVFRMQRTKAPPPIGERAPGVTAPPALEAIAMKLLAKEPAARYTTARAVIAALDEASPGAATTAERAPMSALPKSGSESPGDKGPSALSAVALPQSVVALPEPTAALPGAAQAAPEAGKTSAEAGGYIPRLRQSPSPSKALNLEGIRRWVIPGAIAGGVLVVVIVLFAVFRGGGGDKAANPRGPVEAPSASAAPVASAPKDNALATAEKASSARKQMRSGTEAKEWSRAADGLITLADVSPSSFDDKVVSIDALAIAVAIDVGGGDRAEKVFDALSNKLGSTGLDLLYEIVSTRGGSKASARAAEILRQPEIIARASPGLRIAMELRDAPSCKDKLALLDRARTEGDTRAVAVLDNMRKLPCIPGSGECCFKTNGAVADAVKQIWARLRSPQ